MNTKAARFSPEVRERAVRLVQECQADYASLWGACESIAPKIGCSVSTLHGWVQRKEIDAGQRPGLTTDERERLKQLERENKELRRANDILKAASAFFAQAELDWTQRRSQQGLPRLFSAVGLARETLHQEAPELARRADHVIIDGPPRIAALARSALLAAERVLIPVQPSPYDVWASAEMVALIREAQVFRPALRAAFVINRRVSTTIIGREARQSLAEQPLPALRSEVHQRIVFADSVAAGRLARETAPDSAAAREITALVDELLRWPT